MAKVDELDKKILEMISCNARMPFKDVDADCEKLMQLAMDAGGQDNITVLIASLIGDKDSCPPKPKKSFFSRLFG